MPDPTTEEFVSRLNAEKRERLYKLLDLEPDLEKIVQYSRSRAIIVDAVIKLGQILSATGIIGAFIYYLWGRTHP